MLLCLYDMKWNGVVEGIKEFGSGEYYKGGKGELTYHNNKKRGEHIHTTITLLLMQMLSWD